MPVAELLKGMRVTKSRMAPSRKVVQVGFEVFVDEVTYHRLLTGEARRA